MPIRIERAAFLCSPLGAGGFGGSPCTILYTQLFVFVHLSSPNYVKALSVNAFGFGTLIDPFSAAGISPGQKAYAKKLFQDSAAQHCPS